MQKRGAEDMRRSEVYNEIVLYNDAFTNPVAVFLLETEDTSESSLRQAERLAEKLNLPLIRI